MSYFSALVSQIYFQNDEQTQLTKSIDATLTWVIPAEVYPTYLRSYGMTTSDSLLFLCSFIVTYNFSGMQEAFTPTGLALGFYGGIAVLGWVYQIFFMPETKDKTLEEIDEVFEKPTGLVVQENIANMRRTCSCIFRGRWRHIFQDDKEQEKQRSVEEKEG